LTETSRGEVWTATDLLERLQRRRDSSSWNVRNRDEFEKLRLEGRAPLPALTRSYFEMLELGGKEEMLDSVIAYIELDLARQLPSGNADPGQSAPRETPRRSSLRGLRRLGLPDRQTCKAECGPGVSTMRLAPSPKPKTSPSSR
jgi:hypothetical protein